MPNAQGVTPEHVTEAECQAVADYAANLLTALNMPAWRIHVMTEPAADDTHAEVRATDGKYLAEIWLEKGWMQLDDDLRRETITHEILHLLHQRVSDVFGDARKLMRPREFKQLNRAFVRECELMVDHLAFFLAETHSLSEAWAKAHKGKR